MKWLLPAVLALVLGALPVLAQNGSLSKNDDVDYLGLAALLVGDGNYQRARATLANVDPDDADIDRVRYYTLRGLVALNLDELPLAVDSFRRAIESGEPPDVIWLYLAQAHFGQQQYAETLAALNAAGPANTERPSVYLMRAQCHWELGDPEPAWQVLSAGRQRFPGEAGEFTRRQVYLLVDQGLYQEAAEQGQKYVASADTTVEDLVAIGNALREAGELDRALKILEAARLQYPNNVQVARVLAHTWLGKGKILPAADILRDAAVHEPGLLAEVSELYRRAGWLMQALTLNAQVIDQEKKLRQRLAILVQLGYFDQAAGMEESLFRVGLLADEDIRYALAYSLFKTGDYERAERHLSQLTSSDLFRKANELRRAMARCREKPWLCG